MEEELKENYKEISLEEAKKIMVEMLKEVDKICKKNNINYWLQSGTLLGAIRHGGFIPWDDDIDLGMMRDDFERFKKICLKDLDNKYYLEINEVKNLLEGMPMKMRYKNSIYIEKWDKENDEKKGIFIDIFPFDKFSKNKMKRKIELFPKYLYQLKTMRIWSYNNSLKNIIKFLAILLMKLFPSQIIKKLNVFFYKKSLKKNENESVIGYGYGLTWRRVFNYNDIFPLKIKKFETDNFFVPNNYHKVLSEIYGNYLELPPINKRKTHAAKIFKKEGQ